MLLNQQDGSTLGAGVMKRSHRKAKEVPPVKAVQYLGDHRVSVQEVPEPVAGPGEVLVKPLAVGICGTDLHILEGDYLSNPPMTLGHEVCARVIGLGEGVVSLQVGDLISVEPHLYCGVCMHCQTGNLHMCPTRRAPGVHLDGGMAEFMVVPETIAYKLDPNTNPAIGSMTEPLACAVHGMDRLQPKSGRAIAIFGAGPAGSIIIALAAKAGLSPIVAVEMREQRRELALRMGADVALDPSSPDFVGRMMEITEGDGFPYLIDAVGASHVLEQAIPLASRGGTILVFGVARPDDRLIVSPNEIYAKELTILGTALNPFTHRRAANLVNHLGLENFCFGYFAMDQIDEALQAQRDGRFDKIFITPNGVIA
jgi:L-iditol 2-dehydrogenase